MAAGRGSPAVDLAGTRAARPASELRIWQRLLGRGIPHRGPPAAEAAGLGAASGCRHQKGGAGGKPGTWIGTLELVVEPFTAVCGYLEQLEFGLGGRLGPAGAPRSPCWHHQPAELVETPRRLLTGSGTGLRRRGAARPRRERLAGHGERPAATASLGALPARHEVDTLGRTTTRRLSPTMPGTMTVAGPPPSMALAASLRSSASRGVDRICGSGCGDRRDRPGNRRRGDGVTGTGATDEISDCRAGCSDCASKGVHIVAPGTASFREWTQTVLRTPTSVLFVILAK